MQHPDAATNVNNDLLNLSPDQRHILEKITFEGLIYLVTACAGAGKTRTLSHLVVKAMIHLKQSANNGGGKVLLLTATRSAREEALARVVSLQEVLFQNKLDTGGRLSSSSVRTVHSLALEILKTNLARDHPGATVNIVSQAEIREMLYELLEGIGLNRCESQAAKDLFQDIGIEDQADILAQMRTERLRQFIPVRQQRDPLGPYASFALKQLELLLEGGCKTGDDKDDDDKDDDDDEDKDDDDRGAEGGGAAIGASAAASSSSSDQAPVDGGGGNDKIVVKGDFDALIYGLASSKFPICKRGDILIVDEAQDLSLSQMEIVLTSAEHGASVVVLGDDSQGIHVFSGAVSRTLQTLKREAEGRALEVEHYKLLTNFRSTNQIVQVSEALLPFDDQRLRQGTKATADGPLVQISGWKTARTEADAVAKKIVEMIMLGTDPGTIVVQRHTNFRFDDPVVCAVDRLARAAGVEIPKIILGAGTNNTSLTAKVVYSLQILVGVDRFGSTIDTDEDGDGVFDTLQVFLRNIKGSSGCTNIAKKALASVFRKKRLTNLFELLSLVDDEDGKRVLEAEFVALLRTEAAEAALAATTSTTAGAAKKRRRTELLGDAEKLEKSIKLKVSKFLKMLEAASMFSQALGERFVDIAIGEKHISSIESEYTAASRKQRKAAVGEWSPKPVNMPGLIVWLVTRDILDIKWTPDLAAEFDQLLEKLDVPMDADNDPAAALVLPVTRIIGEMCNKSMEGRLVFSTIHKFKGRERDTAFVMNLQEPYAKVKQAKASALFAAHKPQCKNKHGIVSKCSCPEFLMKLSAMNTAEKDEKRRLIYVGASRAKSRLFLSTNIERAVLNELSGLRCEHAMDLQWAPVLYRRV